MDIINLYNQLLKYYPLNQNYFLDTRVFLAYLLNYKNNNKHILLYCVISKNFKTLSRKEF